MSAEAYEKPELPPEIAALHAAIDANMAHARWVERKLQTLSGAASILGLGELSEQLMQISEQGVTLADEVRKAQHADTARQMREAEEGSHKLFQAILAGAFATPEERAARESQS